MLSFEFYNSFIVLAIKITFYTHTDTIFIIYILLIYINSKSFSLFHTLHLSSTHIVYSNLIYTVLQNGFELKKIQL